ncbi:hypothetical protein ACSWVZ_003259 [Photobacterium damselae]
MHIQLGDTVLETIQITTNRKTMDPIWYEDFNQKLISLGYKEIRHCAWEGAFIFDREERFSIRTPGKRALKKILKTVGIRSLIISSSLSTPAHPLFFFTLRKA